MTTTSTPAARVAPAGRGTEWRLAPGVRLLWRGDGSFHLEDDDGGVVVTGFDRAVAGALARPPRGAEAHRARPVPVEPADRAALERLAELGYVRPVPRAPGLRLVRGADASTGDVVGPADPAGAGPEAADPVRRAARRAARVEVLGQTAVAAYVGALVAAAGVGTVSFGSAGVVRRRHLLPGGLTAADEGRRFAAAAADVVARAAPRTEVGAGGGAEPDLVLLCLDAPAEPDLRNLLHRTRRAHLVVHVDAGRGEVGPLVIPGVSACLRCGDLHRLDHDPAWTVLAVQLLARAGTGVVPDAGLAARTGALAADLAVRWLDGDPHAGGTLDGSWELRPGWAAPRRRGRRPHPECSCRSAWTSGVEDERPARRPTAPSGSGVFRAADDPAGQNDDVAPAWNELDPR